MDLDGDTESWIALSLIPGVGAQAFGKLLLSFGSPERVLIAKKRELAQAVGSAIAQSVVQGADGKRLAETLKWLEEPQNSVLTFADGDYPKALLNIAAPPPLLYLKGNRSFMEKPCFSIVGSRNATPQGMMNAEAFALAMSDAGFCVVSGMALGIDSAAHIGGLKGKSGSMAVCGTGLDIVYPARNRGLAYELAQKGALLSEFPLGMPAMAGNFPRRNRIISGLSVGTLVVEAGLRSGSLITARLAMEQGREVFAVPGSIHSPLSKGAHLLIKQGAKLVESARDILEELGCQVFPQAEKEAESASSSVLEKMGFDPVDMDTLAGRCAMAVDAVSAQLLELELAGRVQSIPGGLYQRLS